MIKIQVLDTSQQRQRLTKAERVILYEKLARSGAIKAFHYPVHLRMIEEMVDEEINTSFTPFVIKYLIKYYKPTQAMTSDTGLGIRPSTEGFAILPKAISNGDGKYIMFDENTKSILIENVTDDPQETRTSDSRNMTFGTDCFITGRWGDRIHGLPIQNELYDVKFPDLKFNNLAFSDRPNLLNLFEMIQYRNEINSRLFALVCDYYMDDAINAYKNFVKENAENYASYEADIGQISDDLSAITDELPFKLPNKEYEYHFSRKTPTSLIDALHKTGLIRLYRIDDATNYSSELEYYDQITKNKYEELAQLKVIWKQQAKQALERKIAVKMFGITNLLKLTRYQRNQIETEMKTDIKQTSKLSLDIKMFRTAVEKRNTAYLQKFLGKIAYNGDMKIIDTPFGPLCSHLIEHARLVLSSKENRLAILARVANKYALSERSDYYCKICGELIVVRDESIASIIGEQLLVETESEDRLTSIIWKELGFVLGSFVRFNPHINLQLLSRNITNLLKTQLSSIDSQLSKMDVFERGGERPVQQTRMLIIYARIYITMLMAFLQNKAPTEIKFKTVKPDIVSELMKEPIIKEYQADAVSGGGTQAEERAKLKQMFSDMEVLLTNTLSKLLSKLVGIVKATDVRIIMAEAYKWSQSMDERFFISTLIPHKDVDFTVYLKTDPFYRFAYDCRVISALRDGIDPPIYNDTSAIIGMELQIIEQRMLSKEPMNLYGSVKGLTLLHKVHNPTEIQLLRENALQHWMSYVQANPYRLAQPPDPGLIGYYMRYEELKPIEISLQNTVKLNQSRFVTDISSSDLGQRVFDAKFIYNPYYEYDDQGRPHKFDLTLYDDGTMKTSKETAEIVKSGKVDQLKNLHAVGAVCSVCGMKSDEVKDDVEQLRKTIAVNRKVSNFYAFYEVICPVEDIHKMSTNDVPQCVKCGITQDIKNKKDMNYYNKHVKSYDLYLKTRQEKFIEKQRDGKSLPPFVPKNIQITSNAEYVHSVAKSHNIEVNVLANIGLSHSYVFKDIVSGKFNPRASATPQQYAYQLRVVMQYLWSFIRTYNSLRHIEMTYEFDSEIMKILRTRKESNEHLKALKEIELSTLQTVIHDNKDYTQVAPYALNTFMGLLHHLERQQPQDMFKEIVGIIVKRLIRSEMLMCMPGVRRVKGVEDHDQDEVSGDDDAPPGDMYESGSSADKYPKTEDGFDQFDLNALDINMDDEDEDDIEFEENADY